MKSFAYKKTILGIAFLIGGLLLWNHSALAQSSRIAISPLVFEITGEPGEEIENYVRVFNPSEDSTLSIRMEVEDIFPAGEAGGVLPSEPEVDTFSLSSWITVEPEEFVLGPREEQRVRFVANVPEGAEPGGHYATVIAGTRSVSGPEGTGVGLAHRIGALVLLTVPGEMTERLDVIEFHAPVYGEDIEKPWTADLLPGYIEQGPVGFVLRFENTGTVHVRPSAIITITNLFGQKVAELPVPDSRVLPGAVRRLDITWDQQWLWGGRYTATLSGTYGRGNAQFSPQVVTFWAFPWKVALAALLLLLFFYVTRRRWYVAFRILVKGESGLSTAPPKNEERKSPTPKRPRQKPQPKA